jgi:nondiscriminating glutamyl-tRNA synthetase
VNRKNEASPQVRTRFAPSPTGHLHIGNARTAIMNWLFAKHSSGVFVLRIEDTDAERSTESSEKSIFEDLNWLGLSWDEGPEREGAFGPYRQSERQEIYRQELRELRESGKVYPCYCAPEELEARREAKLEKGESAVYDGRCFHLTEGQKQKFESEGRKPAFRFHVEQKEIRFTDLVREEVVFQGENIGDFIIVRTDGMPMYNFACAVDDHRMAITHVIRGDDHISNTPRQLLLYHALHWTPPVFAHIPMILGKDRTRLSKRHGATSVAQYQESGYLPDALVNYLSLLSWSSESGEEILSIEQLVREFDFGRISKSAAVFDTEKLDWMNGVYIRQADAEKLSRMALPYFQKAGFPVSSADEIAPVISALQDKVERIGQFAEKGRIFYQTEAVPENQEAGEVLQSQEAVRLFASFLEETDSLNDWSGDVFLKVMKAIQTNTSIKGKSLWMPIRVALTGQVHGPELPRVVAILGLEKCRRFIRAVLENQSMVSVKQ